MLKLRNVEYYKVKKGQTIEEIAEFFCVAERNIVLLNGLCEAISEGQIIKIPKERGNRYTVREGDTKILLCGSEESYFKKNGTDVFYIGMRIVL